ncbi:MAG TPA: hypothetical protein PKI41_09795 [Candidatus Competibacteraceae bacterium]|nr:hypothetical protein [Candidatus Competibacteraceae bacterium]HQA26790.1 hypothetical protein [Candidatus Competibacteraceae bacterium]
MAVIEIDAHHFHAGFVQIAHLIVHALATGKTLQIGRQDRLVGGFGSGIVVIQHTMEFIQIGDEQQVTQDRVEGLLDGMYLERHAILHIGLQNTVLIGAFQR